ncbi:MAG TPA: hypothetical protein VH912_27365 [Streptosporangiaceae bacterium]|jgi:hypothetical protein
MPGAIIAVIATGVLCVSVSIFKGATARMHPLYGSRPFHLLLNVSKSPLWWAGLFVAGIGLALEYVTLSTMPLTAAAPPFAAGFIVLLVIALGVYGERLAGREWAGLGLFAVAGAMVALSVVPGQHADSALPSLDQVLVIAIPSILIPVILFSFGDLKPAGRHARPIGGVAYGLSIGTLTGIGEVAVKGLVIWYDSGGHDPLSLVTEPYVYLIIAGPGLAIFQMQIALQRCRMAIVFSVATVMAQVYMLSMAPLLYGESWSTEPVWVLLRIGGLVLAVVAFVFYPHYDHPVVRVGRAEPAAVPRDEPPVRPSSRSGEQEAEPVYVDFDFSW